MSIYVLKVEEAESSAQNLEDTGDFASRLAAISSGRGGTSLGEIGSDLEKTGSVQGENQKSSNQCVEPPGEPSITDEKKSMQRITVNYTKGVWLWGIQIVSFGVHKISLFL